MEDTGLVELNGIGLKFREESGWVKAVVMEVVDGVESKESETVVAALLKDSLRGEVGDRLFLAWRDMLIAWVRGVVESISGEVPEETVINEETLQ